MSLLHIKFYAHVAFFMLKLLDFFKKESIDYAQIKHLFGIKSVL